MDSHDRLNTVDPTVAKRWVTEYEKNEVELIAYQARYREGRKPFVERRNSIIDRAVDAGLNRDAFKDALKTRALERKIAEIKFGEDEEVAERRELLKEALGGLPLGDWGVTTAAPTEGSTKPKGDKPSAAAPADGFDFSSMTLEDARLIVNAPKGRGRPSAKAVAQRAHAAKMVADAAPGASGAQLGAIAEAMGTDPDESPPDALSSLVEEDNADLRPSWAQ